MDASGRSFWSTGKPPAAGNAGAGAQSQGDGSIHWKVEQYTKGKMCRDDDVVTKPVAAMSFGMRVRVGRIFKSHEEFLDKEIKVAGWAKQCRSQKECCFIEVNDGSCFQGI